MDIEKEYAGRFDWRRAENLERMQQLYDMAGNAGGNVELIHNIYPKLKWIAIDNTPEEALLISLFHAWNQVCECFIFGETQAVIILSRSIAERCLKLEYIRKQGALPAGQKWTLGALINNSAGIIDQPTLDLANELKDPGNDRAHALLEIDDPQAANFGGDRAVEVVGQGYQIYPFAGEAAFAISKAHEILKAVCG